MAGDTSTRVVSFSDLATTITRRPASCGQVRLIAIDGHGGSGKTSFANRLAVSLGGVPVIHTDDFSSWENPHNWWDRFEHDVLEPLERGDRVRYHAYDWAARRLGDWREIPVGDVVLVEGVSSSRQAMRGRLAMAILVDAPLSVRMTRGIARDGEAMRSQWEQWMANEAAHFAMDKTIDRVEFVVDGSPSVPHDPETEFVSLDAPRA
jgi:uridine kinase